MEANGIIAQYKITLKGLLKQKSNVGSGLFNHIFIDFRHPPLRAALGIWGYVYTQKNTHEDLLGIVLGV